MEETNLLQETIAFLVPHPGWGNAKDSKRTIGEAAEEWYDILGVYRGEVKWEEEDGLMSISTTGLRGWTSTSGSLKRF